MRRFNIVFIALFLIVPSVYSIDISKFEGHWKGKGKSIVTWCKQKVIPFDIVIEKDGKISGKIGDAKIKGGKIYSNFLGVLNRHYVIEVELEGYLVKKEKIKRKKMKIMVDVKGDYLVGAFRTSGLKMGDKYSMSMTGADLVLKKVKEVKKEKKK